MSKRKITQAIIHCSDTYDTMDIGADEIRQWHLDRGWDDIGYHFIIRRDGTVETGRDLDGDGDILEEIGAHALGYNKHSVGICIVGGKPQFNFTLAQINRAKTMVEYLKALYPGLQVKGHNEVSDKPCPMFDAGMLLEN